jgi:hypothetical protein
MKATLLGENFTNTSRGCPRRTVVCRQSIQIGNLRRKVCVSKEFTNDDPALIGTGAIKYDGGKVCTYRGLIQYFPRAATAVAEISTFGAKKYAWAGWEGVDDGINRYSDAMARHLMKEAMGEEVDPDSGLLHASHLAWGALARLELILREKENASKNG